MGTFRAPAIALVVSVVALAFAAADAARNAAAAAGPPAAATSERRPALSPPISLFDPVSGGLWATRLTVRFILLIQDLFEHLGHDQHFHRPPDMRPRLPVTPVPMVATATHAIAASGGATVPTWEE